MHAEEAEEWHEGAVVEVDRGLAEEEEEGARKSVLLETSSLSRSECVASLFLFFIIGLISDTPCSATISLVQYPCSVTSNANRSGLENLSYTEEGRRRCTANLSERR